MRIMSKDRDYYDSIQGVGYDPKLIYQRFPKEVTVQQQKEVLSKIFPTDYRQAYLPKFRIPFHFDKSSLRIMPSFVGFCGKLYMGVTIEYREDHAFRLDRRATLYDFESFEKFLGDIAVRKRIKDAIEPARRTYETHIVEKVRKYFRKFRQSPQFVEDIFFELKTPIFTYHPTDSPYVDEEVGVFTDSLLKDFDFFRVMDPYTCYQEIAMFISGVLGVGNPDTVEIDDIAQRDKKGFNDMSFKTESPGKKAKRRKKA